MTGIAMQAETPRSKEILGHPRGLAYLAFAEAWERFSYYGMLTLLVLYMSQHLLLPGHVENVAGFAAFRQAIESVYGPLSPVALASTIFGLYAGGVFLTPILGGLIADRLLGRTATITIGAIAMAVGHFLMAFEASFLLALSCLVIGVGLFKGNIAAQVGELYRAGDLRRADGFQIYMFGIQVSGIVSPLVCGTLGERVGWHWGFGAAGVGMLLGLAVYLAGRKHLPKEAPRRTAAKTERARFTARDWRAVLVLAALLPVLALAMLGNQQMFNAYMIWGDANYDLVFFGQTMPMSWLLSLDGFISAGTMIAAIAFWRLYSLRWKEPDEIAKLVVGALIAACGPLLLAAACMQQELTGEKASLAYGVAFHIINDFGVAMLLPVGLALYTRAAPQGLTGVMVGVYYLHAFMANMAVGRLGGLVESMSGTNFWLMHAGLVAIGALLLLAFALLFHKTLAPAAERAAEA